MAADELGPWEPLTVPQVVDLLRGYDQPWWIAGGQAIDLFVGRQTRPHGDVDVQVLHRDQCAVRAHMHDWDLHAADPPGALRPWPLDEVLDEAIHDVWCRPAPDVPWSLQLMLLSTEEDRWVFRRDRRIGGSLATFGLRRDGVPFVAPEVQLLYKSKSPRATDDVDFEEALPLLDGRQRDWLITSLETHVEEHPWISRLRGDVFS
ncbi:MAG: nucleotidyltransferase domain-containing protein [Thermomicrobiales bacterium]